MIFVFWVHVRIRGRVSKMARHFPVHVKLLLKGPFVKKEVLVIHHRVRTEGNVSTVAFIFTAAVQKLTKEQSASNL